VDEQEQIGLAVRESASQLEDILHAIVGPFLEQSGKAEDEGGELGSP
jgi:hypothetical protein